MLYNPGNLIAVITNRGLSDKDSKHSKLLL